jgi:hypothetical protein
MQRIILLLIFASLGALLTMLLLPPFPIYRVYSQKALRGYRARTVGFEHEPIAGHPAYTITQFRDDSTTDVHSHKNRAISR